MRRIERTAAFKRDYRRIKAIPRLRDRLDVVLAGALLQLQADMRLMERYRDHALSGQWNGCRDCHLLPDLVLIYSKPTADVLRLIRLGSHSELFG